MSFLDYATSGIVGFGLVYGLAWLLRSRVPSFRRTRGRIVFAVGGFAVLFVIAFVLDQVGIIGS